MLNIIHRVGAFFAWLHSGVYLLLGLASIPLLRLIIGSRAVELLVGLLHHRWLVLVELISIVFIPACSVFYGEQFVNHMKVAGTRLQIPEPDTFFYETQTSSISLLRKIAGYVYVLGKIWFFTSVGVLLYFGFFIARLYK